MPGRDSDKGLRYIAALDSARCQNKWDEVPELIRKVTKHAPHKSCLLESASAEYQVAIEFQKKTSATPTFSASASSLHELIPSLLSTIERADGTKQDVFQAQVCLGWVHWTLNEPGLAAARLPRNFLESMSNLNSAGEDLSSWTKVCLVKGCYIKGAAQHMVTDPDEALDTFNSLTEWLNGYSQASSLNNPQFLHWSEHLVAEGALLAGDKVCRNIPDTEDELVETALRLFRLWASHPYVKNKGPSAGVHGQSPDPSAHSLIWKSYYDLLSTVMKWNLFYTPQGSGPARPQLAREIRHIEAICEGNLLREVKFPTAQTRNDQVEGWVEQVIENWEILCGCMWTDEELGEGGQDAVSRNVLEMLYRAAAKTYHSHLILKRLFHVHSALAEFDLALKALDSYLEIVTNAKERAEKGAEFGELENEGTVLRTLSEGVTMLCCFGSLREAEKAVEYVSLMKKVVAVHVEDAEDDQGQGKLLINQETSSTRSQAVSALDISCAYRGIGIGLANWAYWTPVSEERDDIRSEAVEYLERSLAPELGDDMNYSAIYTLALLLAEDRDLDGAIDYVKSALTCSEHPGNGLDNFARERDLVPLWHLLALLLSAKEDFDIAERSCEAAFEQFPNAVTSLRPHKQHSNIDQSNASGLKNALIGQLRNREKERLIETRMTQLAFIELGEGPEAAVNRSDQLLGLFAALFDNLDLSSDEKNRLTVEQLAPPKGSAGSAKTFRGSFFGRHKAPRDRSRSATSEFQPGSPTASGAPSLNQRESPANTDAPSIQITDEGRNPGYEGSRLPRKPSSNLRQPDGPYDPSINGDGDYAGPAEINGARTTSSGPSTPRDMAGQQQNGKQPLRPIPHNMKHTNIPPPVGHPDQPPEQDVRLPVSYSFDSPTRAVTKFPTVQSQKHALGILVKIWLLIAGLYRRASLFEDANEACEEAGKHVAHVEALVAAHESSARSFRERGWGVPKSSDELSADLWAERGLLSQAYSQPHVAMEHFENALNYDPDHPLATLGLANLLLDIWDKKMPLAPPEPGLEVPTAMLSLLPAPEPDTKPNGTKDKRSRASVFGKLQPQNTEESAPSSGPDSEPKLLNRIAARERAYGMLSALTKRGSSWDNSAAWFALTRTYEAEGQVEKLKEVLWWCIELEDRRPIRHWSNIGSGVYVL